MRIRLYIMLLSAITICIAFLSCHEDLSSTNDFLITVDSIKAPDSVVSNTSFDIEFFGTIGFDECTSFKTYNRTYENNDIIIEVWGTYDSTTKTCPPALVALEGQKLKMTISLPGTYRILIKDPGNITLVKQITVN